MQIIDRLRIGYDAKEDRLVIPYYKNGYVAYYVERDRSGKSDASKYKKAHLDGVNENIPWGLHTLNPEHLDKLHELRIQELSTASNTPLTAKDEKNFVAVEAQLQALRIFNFKKYLVIAEGAFDALSFEQEGFKVLSPISGYFNKESLKQVINIAQHEECVFICFDSDKAGNKFQLDMAKLMFKNRVNFVCGRLPEGVKDISDFYCMNGNLCGLVNDAESGIKVLAEHITDRDEFKKFVYEAARFVDEPELKELFSNVKQFPKAWLNALEKKALKPPVELIVYNELVNTHRLKFAEGLGFYEYKHGVWNKLSDNAVRGYISDILGHWAGGNKQESILKLVKAKLTTEEIFNRQAIFNFTNGILDLKTGHFKEHSELYMSTVQVNYEYNPDKDAPMWKKFINEVMNDNEAMCILLQEAVGYILFEDNSLQKCFILTGDGANGKSVFLNVLTELFGKDSVSNVEMSGLTEPFQRISLIDSILNISTETHSNLKDSESVFKQVVAGDYINGCYKNKDFKKFRPRCKMFMACNNYIQPQDMSNGFLRRLCFINFPREFKGADADKTLPDKLRTELSGIFNWAYEGYLLLKKTLEFISTPEQSELLREFTLISNPIVAFIEDVMTIQTGTFSRDDLYKLYVKWCGDSGYKPTTRNSFIQDFRKSLKQLKTRRVEERNSHGKRYFIFS